ncbi:hypothetical protein D9613_002525 [Agrocybe pediades]|uniref:Scd6-like Sm domain-containing protein n=1 Tax=Agrocybe pediades TaxID=84607 RepID=A0A8H4QP59_9AGAR|nr:hypothetical protein D9613_002525 [Agrocybe pediades]KAF9555237.1 hypothetical protein CPC08DRAFT_712217 [Agrocybe pediades]
MALSFIGKPISLISHSDVRYRGILAGIDPQASTIQLSNVYSMGTESRRPANQFIAPVQDPYAYIIFRASEVKDLSVDEPAPPQHNVHDDPAVLGAGGPAPQAYPAYPAQQPVNGAPPQPPQPAYAAPPPAQSAPAPAQQQAQPAAQQPGQPTANRNVPQQNNNNTNNTRRPNPVHTAAASLETVERALGDLRVSGSAPNHAGGPRGGRRGGHQGGRGGHRAVEAELKVPQTDFDFASSNAKFDKAAISPGVTKATTDDGNASADAAEGDKATEKEVQQPAYNPKQSFFDSLSSSAATPAAGSAPGGSQGNHHRGGRRGGGGGAGRNRREEEREKNVATFGEPGGVGLLGPGGYVGGWGGYGRRGGRPRRGGPGRGQGGGGNANAPQVQARG